MRELTKEQKEVRQTYLNILTLYLAVTKKVVASGDLFKAVNEAGEWVFSFDLTSITEILETLKLIKRKKD